METEKKRKVRSDKKRDVKPYISMNLKDCIYRLSYITDTPVKDVSENIIDLGFDSRIVLDYLSQYFRRPLRMKNTVYLGDLDRESLQKRNKIRSERITIRFKQHTYENITALSYALDVTPSRATALLLEASVKNSNIINEYVRKYLEDRIDQNRMKELKQVLKYINENNPYEENISWVNLLSYIIHDLKSGAKNISDSVQEWLHKLKE